MTDFKEIALKLPSTHANKILNIIPSRLSGHASFLNWLIKKINPQVTVNLGVGYGYSSFVMSKNQDNPVYAIDSWSSEYNSHRTSESCFEDDYLFVLAIKEKLNLDNLIVIKDTFDNFAYTWKSINKKIDLLYIDGMHDYKSCKHNYKTWNPFLNENAVVLLHDAASYLDDIEKSFFNELNIPKINLYNSHGLGIASKNEEIIFEIKEKFKL